jgi:hypothetical protein
VLFCQDKIRIWTGSFKKILISGIRLIIRPETGSNGMMEEMGLECEKGRG